MCSLQEFNFSKLYSKHPVFVQKMCLAYTELIKRAEKKVLLYLEDPIDFLLVTLASLLAGKDLFFLHTAQFLNAQPLINTDTLYICDDEHTKISLRELYKNNIEEQIYDSIKTMRIDANSCVVFYTSGSTGIPKFSAKKVCHIDAELRQLFTDFNQKLDNSIVLSTVPHFHFYGFLFYVLLPLITQYQLPQKQIRYPESFSPFLESKKITLISSPAFLKRLDASDKYDKNQWTVFSSGGLLDMNGVENCITVFNTEPIEIYGSTETGGIAWRCQKTYSLWTPFSCLQVKSSNSNVLTISSPYFDDPVMEAGDFVRFHDNIHFELLGRTDSTVKVEGKRVDLKNIDYVLNQRADIKDTHTLLYSSRKREYIVCFVVVEESSELQTLSQKNRLQARKKLTSYLSKHFDKTVVPKKMFFLPEIPRNQMSKINQSFLLDMLENESGERYVYKVIELTENQAVVSVFFPEHSVYFHGHFPDFPILPAVAQVKTIFDISKTVFSHSYYIKSAKRIKFTAFIRPNKELLLKLSIDEDKKLSFELYDENKKYSSGIFFLEKL